MHLYERVNEPTSPFMRKGVLSGVHEWHIQNGRGREEHQVTHTNLHGIIATIILVSYNGHNSDQCLFSLVFFLSFWFFLFCFFSRFSCFSCFFLFSFYFPVFFSFFFPSKTPLGKLWWRGKREGRKEGITELYLFKWRCVTCACECVANSHMELSYVSINRQYRFITTTDPDIKRMELSYVSINKQ